MSDDLARLILADLAIIKAKLGTTPAPMADRSLTRREAAKYLGIHPKTLALSEVTGYRDGPRGRWKYRLSELDRYRDDRTPIPRPTTQRPEEIDWGA